jgi:nicotinate phosphoribosyltransferase
MYDPSHLTLLTDLYQLTMMQGYFNGRLDESAVFDMFFRRQPFEGGYAIFAGISDFLDSLSRFSFSSGDIEYLEGLGLFKDDFLQYLSDFSFKGSVYAMEEGSVVFPNEPLVRVEGNILEAQLVETLLLNSVNFPTLIATKAARIVHAAGSDTVLEFGLRRAQGSNGALTATKSAFTGGVAGTSNVLAGRQYGIPVKGTMAHSWIMSFESELAAFRKYAEIYPDSCVLLVDTYDTLASGVPNAIKVFKELKERGHTSGMGIRLDSGDLCYLSIEARHMLDEAGLDKVIIVASNDLDEYIVANLKQEGSRIDAWGIGTRLVTAHDDPSLTGVYKITSKTREGTTTPCIKLSNNPIKTSNPGIKNVMRFYDSNGSMTGDLIYLEEEKDQLCKAISRRDAVTGFDTVHSSSSFLFDNYHDGVALLKPAWKDGKRCHAKRTAKEMQAFATAQLASLDKRHKRLMNPHLYQTGLSFKLKTLKEKMIQEKKQQD